MQESYWLENSQYYDSWVIIYNFRVFIRLAIELRDETGPLVIQRHRNGVHKILWKAATAVACVYQVGIETFD